MQRHHVRAVSWLVIPSAQSEGSLAKVSKTAAGKALHELNVLEQGATLEFVELSQDESWRLMVAGKMGQGRTVTGRATLTIWTLGQNPAVKTNAR